MDNLEVFQTWNNNIINANTNGWCFTPLEKVQARLRETGYPEEKLHYIVGDVMETLKEKSNIPDKIAILRLDTDWYESSKIELEKLYDNVVKGGLIIFDDYCWKHCPGVEKALHEFRSIDNDFIHKPLPIINQYVLVKK